MNIDFNMLRINLVNNYNTLVSKLNSGIVEDIDYSRVVIPVHEIKRLLDNFRYQLVLLSSLYQDNDDDCKCLNDLEINTFMPED